MFFRVAPRGPVLAHVASPKRANKEANPATERHSARRVASVAKPGGEAKMTAQYGSLDPNRMTVEQAARVLSANEPHYRYSDPFRTLLRIHTKHVATESI